MQSRRRRHLSTIILFQIILICPWAYLILAQDFGVTMLLESLQCLDEPRKRQRIKPSIVLIGLGYVIAIGSFRLQSFCQTSMHLQSHWISVRGRCCCAADSEAHLLLPTQRHPRCSHPLPNLVEPKTPENHFTCPPRPILRILSSSYPCLCSLPLGLTICKRIIPTWHSPHRLQSDRTI
jgi:hypothetical protein